MKQIYTPDISKIISYYLIENDIPLHNNIIDTVLLERPDLRQGSLNIIQFLLENNEPFTINGIYSVAIDNKHYARVSLNDIVTHLVNYNDKTVLSLIRDIPSSLLVDLWKDGLYNIRKREFKKRLVVSDTKDTKFSIFFLDELQNLENFINRHLTLGYDAKVLDLLPMAIRIFIPKETIFQNIDRFNSYNLIYSEPLMINNHLVCENLEKIDDYTADLIRQNTILDNTIYKCLDQNSLYLSSNVVYSTIITMSIYEWWDFIRYMKEPESKLQHPVVSSIPMMIYPQHRGIYKLLTGDN